MFHALISLQDSTCAKFTRVENTFIMNQQAADPRVNLAQDRTGMAKFRTQLALDRTTLAWIRTTLTMATFGFGTIGFFRSMREKSPTPEAIQLHEGARKFAIVACDPGHRCHGTGGNLPLAYTPQAASRPDSCRNTMAFKHHGGDVVVGDRVGVAVVRSTMTD